MKHFVQEQWLDFVRGVAPADAISRMAAHLASGCARCGRIVRRYRAMIELARADQQTEIPEFVADRAKQLFSGWARQRFADSAPTPMSGSLLFDTFFEPALAGVRGQRGTIRQLLYRFGSYYIDLREEHDPWAPKASLVGQVADFERPPRSVSSLPALLLSGTRIVARALTNEFGEFQMEYHPRKGLRLVLMMDGATATFDVSPPRPGSAPKQDSNLCQE